MIRFPIQTEEAYWLARPVKDGPNGPWKKHYIIAWCGPFLFRVFNKPDGTYLGNIVEATSSLPLSEYQSKLQEKERKGYSKIAKWGVRTKAWIDPVDAGIKQFPPIVGEPKRSLEDCVSKVELRASDFNKTFQTIKLELWRTAAGHYRLDQTDSAQPSSQRGIPAWQTLLSNEQKAKKILQDVIENRTNQGYVAYLLSGATHANPSGLADIYPLTRLGAVPMGGGDGSWFCIF